MSFEQRWYTLKEAAKLTGLGSASYWSDVERDRRRRPCYQTFSAKTHAKYPRAVKVGGMWMVHGSVLARHTNRLLADPNRKRPPSW